jgi:hypothetical protein
MVAAAAKVIAAPAGVRPPLVASTVYPAFATVTGWLNETAPPAVVTFCGDRVRR